MFEQLLWYHSKYPEGIWEAIVIKFSGNSNLLNIMYQKCVECGFFSKIVCYNYRMIENSMVNKVSAMMRYIFGIREDRFKRNGELADVWKQIQNQVYVKVNADIFNFKMI